MVTTVRQRSWILRLAAWGLAVISVLALIGLVSETLDFIWTMPAPQRGLPLLRLVLLGLANLLMAVLITITVTLYLLARMSRSLPELEGWHSESLDEEFCASDAKAGYTLDDYCAQEERVFEKLRAYVNDKWSSGDTSAYNRYHAESICNPDNLAVGNWNRTRILEHENPVGGALLLHGLSDAPYSLRAFGERLHREGYTVVWLRVPGHGTTPRALAEVSWADWVAAVRVAAVGLRRRLPDSVPMILGGYSNGGALSVNYALEAIESEELPRADAVVLFSPMIGINPMARMTRLYHAIGLFSRTEKSKWSNIYAEIDPFKYSSWPMNANVQAWSMTKAVEKRLDAMHKSGRIGELPPMLAAQSVVDSTVRVPKLITSLFDRLSDSGSELFLIDVNRVDRLSNLVNLSFEDSVLPTLRGEDKQFRLAVLANAKKSTSQLSLWVRNGEDWDEEPQTLSWPTSVVSLSHVAVPIPPNDSLYGDGSASDGLSFGTMTMRAEPSTLMVPTSLFARCRHNPFYEFMENRIVHWLGDVLSQTGQAASAGEEASDGQDSFDGKSRVAQQGSTRTFG